MKTKNEDLLLAVKTARAYEKVAIAEAKRRAEERVKEETIEAHDKLLDSVRDALMAGATARQIGIAYGSSDARTAKKLVEEAMMGDDGQSLNPHPNWKLSRNQDGTFNITVYSLGESGMSGHALCRLDDDGENFSVIEGDMWIQIQLYKLGYKDEVLSEAKGE
jgi:hypothetical protein